VLSTLNPIIATVETMGLVALPGMMTGQILGGTLPIIAIKYQIAIMLAILGARYLSVLAALWLTSLRAFDDYDVLSL
jgi:putative ABC transport system permease protein